MAAFSMQSAYHQRPDILMYHIHLRSTRWRLLMTLPLLSGHPLDIESEPTSPPCFFITSPRQAPYIELNDRNSHLHSQDITVRANPLSDVMQTNKQKLGLPHVKFIHRCEPVLPNQHRAALRPRPRSKRTTCVACAQAPVSSKCSHDQKADQL